MRLGRKLAVGVAEEAGGDARPVVPREDEGAVRGRTDDGERAAVEERRERHEAPAGRVATG